MSESLSGSLTEGSSVRVCVCVCARDCKYRDSSAGQPRPKVLGAKSRDQKVSGAKFTNITSAGLESSGTRGEVGLQREAHNL